MAFDVHVEPDVAAADYMRKRRVDHPLQYATPPDPGSVIRARLLELPYDGNVSDGHPLDSARHVVDETNTDRV